MAELSLKPIGFFKGSHSHKSSLPRQGRLSQQKGFIQFQGPFDFKSALKGLEKMSHCWIIFSFHKAESEPKPLVRPPRKPEIQIGVWATRSPYRPNSMGLTLARIEGIQNGNLLLSQVDILDGTPIWDIKPYVTESDQPKKPKQGWIDEIEVWKYQFSKKAKQQTKWLLENGLTEILDVLESQFGTPPLQPKRKRLKKTNDGFVLSYRTWRFHFRLDPKKRKSTILEIKSGYSEEELETAEDPYHDKSLHKRFRDSI